MKNKKANYSSIKSLNRKISILVFLIVTVSVPALGTVKLPDTGQKSRFDEAGNVIYTGMPPYGQDADYKGFDPSYESGAEGTVIDKVTGLMWQNTIARADNGTGLELSWQDAVNYCNNLSYAGYSDWRLPSIVELLSIAYFDRYDPTLSTSYFRHDPVDHWSSTTCATDPDYVWSMDFFGGWAHIRNTKTANGDLSTSKFRCVRGPAYSFEGEIGLMWQAEEDGTITTWSEALSYCENLDDEGYTDWRLPNYRELATLVHYEQVDPSLEGDTSYYWSSTTWTSWPVQAYRISVLKGEGSCADKSVPLHVRCVRGGQVPTITPLISNLDLPYSEFLPPSQLHFYFKCENCGSISKNNLEAETGCGDVTQILLREPSGNSSERIVQVDISPTIPMPSSFQVRLKQKSLTDAATVQVHPQTEPFRYANELVSFFSDMSAKTFWGLQAKAKVKVLGKGVEVELSAGAEPGIGVETGSGLSSVLFVQDKDAGTIYNGDYETESASGYVEIKAGAEADLTVASAEAGSSLEARGGLQGYSLRYNEWRSYPGNYQQITEDILYQILIGALHGTPFYMVAQQISNNSGAAGGGELIGIKSHFDLGASNGVSGGPGSISDEQEQISVSTGTAGIELKFWSTGVAFGIETLKGEFGHEEVDLTRLLFDANYNLGSFNMNLNFRTCIGPHLTS